MRCPFCQHLEDKVIDSRVGSEGATIRRRRECLSCARRFTTYERVEEVLPTVVKKDGRREPFDRQKVLAGLRLACKKRPISVDQVNEIVDRVEQGLAGRDSREVDAAELGEHIMTHLRELDEVAYVRFASVYRSFRDLDEFHKEVGKLVRSKT